MSITMKPFGIDQIGRPMTLYTLTNKNGASVSVLDFGAHLVSVRVPDREGKLADVCLGFDTLEEYDQKPGFLGAIVGRYGNRIGGSRFSLNGQEYSLFPNDGKNSLHGGREGFDKKWWKGQTLEAEGEDALVLTYVAHDGEEGYPGKLRVQVTYAWDDQNALTIRYLAQSDKDTVVNLTNHAYWNLAGAGAGNILDHTLQINADCVTDVDDELIPNGKYADVTGTPLDLRAPTRIGDGIARMGECHLMENVAGYDINYVLRGEGMKEAAVLYDAGSGREMRVLTEEPGIQFYSAQTMDQTGKGGAHYGNFAGAALETQHYPDSPNHPEFPSTVLKAGDVYKTATVYAFSVR
ncbi:MAG: galactose mutarotase [Clostridiales bacterium]|nr:galactose mutarotase [Clostridiales bacterium]